MCFYTMNDEENVSVPRMIGVGGKHKNSSCGIKARKWVPIIILKNVEIKIIVFCWKCKSRLVFHLK